MYMYICHGNRRRGGGQGPALCTPLSRCLPRTLPVTCNLNPTPYTPLSCCLPHTRVCTHVYIYGPARAHMQQPLQGTLQRLSRRALRHSLNQSI